MLGRSTSHGTCCLLPNHQVWNDGLHRVLSALSGGIWVHSWAGKKPATCEICGKTFPRSNVTLSDLLHAESEGIKVTRSRNSSPAMSRKSSVVSWSDSTREQLETNVLPREQSAPFGDVVEEAVLEDASGSWEPRELAVISSFPTPVVGGTVPSTCPLRNVTSAPESSGELRGTLTVTRTAQRMSSAHTVPFVPSGAELASRATYISREKRNRETSWRQSKALKRVQREAKRKLVAQPQISHEAAEAFLKSQTARTVEKFPGTIRISHQLALLHGHENVFFCTQCGAVNDGGSLRLLKSLCDGSDEFRQKARRKLERGLMPNEHVVADAKPAC